MAWAQYFRFQDRRPASNADPYAVTGRIIQTMILDAKGGIKTCSRETQTPDISEYNYINKTPLSPTDLDIKIEKKEDVLF